MVMSEAWGGDGGDIDIDMAGARHLRHFHWHAANGRLSGGSGLDIHHQQCLR